MIMADVLKIFLLVTGTLIVLIAYWLAAESLRPRLVSDALGRYRAQPIRITLIGTFIGAPIVVVGFGLLQAGSAPAKAIGFLIISAAMLAGLLGSAGLCRRIGAGLPSPADDAQPWRRVLRGGTVLSLMFLLPFLGWFLILPLTLASGLGATLLSIFSLRRKAVTPARVASSQAVAQ